MNLETSGQEMPGSLTVQQGSMEKLISGILFEKASEHLAELKVMARAHPSNSVLKELLEDSFRKMDQIYKTAGFDGLYDLGGKNEQ